MLKSIETVILKVSEEQLGDLEEGEFYYHEIIGCTVVHD